MSSARSDKVRYEVRRDGAWTYLDFYFNGDTNLVGIALPRALARQLSKDLGAPEPLRSPRKRK